MRFQPVAPLVAALFLVAGTLGAAPLSQDPNKRLNVAVSDPNLRYVGRWDRTNPAVFHGHWGGVYLRTAFTGTSIAIRLTEATDLVVVLDGEAPRGIHAQAGITPLHNTPLAPGNHTLLVGSAGQNFEVALAGLLLDAGATTLPPPTRPLIEFVGDSITTFGGPPDASIVNYAWLTGEALGCDHVQVSFSARALTSGYGCAPDKTGLDIQYFRLKNFNHLDDNPQVSWTFSYQPRIVVINLGQNDQCGSEPAATFQANMVAFVRRLRTHYPTAHLVVLRPFSGAYAEAARVAVKTLTTARETRVHFVDTTGWLDQAIDFTDGTHPTYLGHLKIVAHLSPLLRPLLTVP